MTIQTHINTSTGWKEVNRIYIYTSSGWKEVVRAWTFTETGWQLVHITELNIVISTDTLNFNLKTAIEQALSITNLDFPVEVTVTVNSGVVVGSDVTFTTAGSGYTRYRTQSIKGPAFTTADMPTGSIIKLINNGVIAGAGGIGGRASNSSGGTGGTAIQATVPISITNNGIIAGGGGGGTGYYSSGDHIMGGGAGAGSKPALGQQYGYHGRMFWLPSSTLYNGGHGGNDPYSGAGGALGMPGKKGSASVSVSGGAAGYYIDGNDNVTWVKAGDCRGRFR